MNIFERLMMWRERERVGGCIVELCCQVVGPVGILGVVGNNNEVGK